MDEATGTSRQGPVDTEPIASRSDQNRSILIHTVLSLVFLVALRFAVVQFLTLVVDVVRHPGLGRLFLNLLLLVLYLTVTVATIYLRQIVRGRRPFPGRAEMPGLLRAWSSRGVLAQAWLFAVLLLALPVVWNYVEHTNGCYNPKSWVEKHPGVWYHQPGTELTEQRGAYHMLAHINDDGFRCCAPPNSRQEGNVTVALVGDSYVFGQGINDPDTLCWKLRDRLDTEFPDKYHLINAAFSGANLDSYVRMARMLIEEHDADIILLGLLMPNDANPMDVMSLLTRSKYSGTFHWLGAILSPSLLQDAAFIAFESLVPHSVCQFLVQSPLQRLVELAEETGKRFILYSYNWRAEDMELFAKFAAKSEHITFLGPLQPPEDGREYYIPNDGHPTGLANEIFSEILADALLGK